MKIYDGDITDSRDYLSVYDNKSVYLHYYHTSNSRNCTGVNGEALQVHTVNIFGTTSLMRILIRYYNSCNPYQILQVMRSVSGTTSHTWHA